VATNQRCVINSSSIISVKCVPFAHHAVSVPDRAVVAEGAFIFPSDPALKKLFVSNINLSKI
jgi:hypothetical protein